ncbi:MAG: T9SS type A sorting domain-containing protein [Saprospiraceae bacterium]|nr:T9SS type A sorting domain-containing protein [Candidatus Vicinibacter affinis]MBK7799974.1 T9SS type A sorting domain-containing protein [Candidatus Vicinibacter affinis]
MKKIIILVTIILQSVFAYAQVTDFEGNIYDTVVIGKQTWLKQNLRSKYYSDGVPIPQEYYLPTKGIDSLVKRYGYLYHYKAYSRDERGKKIHGACPQGYFIATPAELHELMVYLDADTTDIYWGHYQYVSKKLADISWQYATNSSGLSLLPTGLYSDKYKDFFNFGSFTYIPLINETGIKTATIDVQISSNSVLIEKQFYSDQFIPCRCLKGDVINENKDIGRETENDPLYPNPGTNNIYVPEGKSEPFFIFNSGGLSIHKGMLENGSFNVGHLITGNYVIKIQFKGKEVVYKFIKI